MSSPTPPAPPPHSDPGPPAPKTRTMFDEWSDDDEVDEPPRLPPAPQQSSSATAALMRIFLQSRPGFHNDSDDDDNPYGSLPPGDAREQHSTSILPPAMTRTCSAPLQPSPDRRLATAGRTPPPHLLDLFGPQYHSALPSPPAPAHHLSDRAVRAPGQVKRTTGDVVGSLEEDEGEDADDELGRPPPLKRQNSSARMLEPVPGARKEEESAKKDEESAVKDNESAEKGEGSAEKDEESGAVTPEGQVGGGRVVE